MIFTRTENLRRYISSIPELEKIIKLVEGGKLLDAPLGEHVTESGIKYNLQEYAPKEEKNSIYEYHKVHLDVQVMLKGIEKCKHSLMKGDPDSVNDESDSAEIESEADEECLLKEGTSVIYFPLEVHKPGIKVTDGINRKVVFKVPYPDK